MMRSTSYYFARTVFVIAAFGFVLQACGQNKNDTPDPKARKAATPAANPAAKTDPTTDSTAGTTPSSAVSKVDKPLNQISNAEVDFTILKDKMVLKIVKVSRTEIKDGEITATADLTLNGKAFTVEVTNNTSDAGDSKVSTVKGDSQETDGLYVIDVNGTIDFQNPENYFMILKVAKVGKEDATDADATQEIGLVIGSSGPAAKGQMVLDNPGKDSLDYNGKSGFLAWLQGKFKSVVMTATSVPFTSSGRVQFQIADDKFDISIDSSNLKRDDDKNPKSAKLALALKINDTAVPVVSATDDLSSDDLRIRDAVDLSTTPLKLDYTMSVRTRIDPKSPKAAFIEISLGKKTGRDEDSNSREFVVAIGDANDSLKKGVLMLNLPYAQSSSDAQALSPEDMVQVLKNSLGLNNAAPTPVANPTDKATEPTNVPAK